MNFRKMMKSLKSMFVGLVCFGLYIDIVSVSMRFSAVFYICEHISKYILGFLYIIHFVYILLIHDRRRHDSAIQVNTIHSNSFIGPSIQFNSIYRNHR